MTAAPTPLPGRRETRRPSAAVAFILIAVVPHEHTFGSVVMGAS
jgi:hypothetical protein